MRVEQATKRWKNGATNEERSIPLVKDGRKQSAVTNDRQEIKSLRPMAEDKGELSDQ